MSDFHSQNTLYYTYIIYIFSVQPTIRMAESVSGTAVNWTICVSGVTLVAVTVRQFKCLRWPCRTNLCKKRHGLLHKDWIDRGHVCTQTHPARCT